MYGKVSAFLDLSLTQAEIQEIVNAANIMYGSPSLAVISEVGLVSGCDRAVQINAGSAGQIAFNEIIAAQITTFINCSYALQYISTQLGMGLDIGALDPLFKISPPTTTP